MRRIVFQGLTIIVSFLALWFILMQVDWMTIFKIEQATKKTEEKLGQLFWEFISHSQKETDDSFLQASIDSLMAKICSENSIDRKNIKLHIVETDEVNAFALPDGHLILYTGLIASAENQMEVAGVLCHELAHIELNHVMKKLVKEVGLSILVSLTTGNGNGDILKETAKLLSSTAFDRQLEQDADMKAIDYMVEAHIDPEPFAEFLYRLSSENGIEDYLTWISTHPDSNDRAEYIIENIDSTATTVEPILSETTWQALQQQLTQE